MFDIQAKLALVKVQNMAFNSIDISLFSVDAAMLYANFCMHLNKQMRQHSYADFSLIIRMH